MSYTDTWNAAFEALPADANNISEGADRIRDLKLAIRERIAKDHYMDVAGTDADHGEHSKVTLRTGAAPSAVANKGIIYAKDVGGKAELFYIDEDSHEVQLTSAGNINYAYSNWTAVTAFTATPPSTSTLTMTSDLTTSMLVGKSLRYTIGGTIYYGQVSAIASNLLTVRGAPLSGDVTALAYGGGSLVQMVLPVNGSYEDASNSALIASDNSFQLLWELEAAKCVAFKAWSKTHDTGATHGAVNVTLNGNAVSTSNTNTGLLLAADATWYATVVDLNVSNYGISNGQVIELSVTKGTNGDAANLCVIAIFLIP